MENIVKKEIWAVPKGVRYIGQYPGFELPNSPHIMNKVITGCGFTEYFLRPNPKYPKVILVSPRRVLLENKEEQHNRPSDGIDIGKIYYARNDLDKETGYDIDLNAKKVVDPKYIPISENEEKNKIITFKNNVKNYVESCWLENRDIRIVVTYDSFRLVKEALGETIHEYQIVVDEFQSVLQDSKFKSSTELELLYHLQDLKCVCFLSATPMLDKYILKLQSFKNLPYYELDWKTLDPTRITKPNISSKQCTSIVNAAKEEIDKYLNGKFERFSWRDENGIIREKYSTELVLYCNSVKNISDIIRKCNLLPNQCNILCAINKENITKIKSAFKQVYEKLGYSSEQVKDIFRKNKLEIGKVPQKGQTHKMFTFCTRTVYLGADFYSTNARSLILSDANIDCLAVDIAMDLIQIMGRQRLDENPWKDCILFRFKTNTDKLTPEEFEEKLNQKIQKSYNKLQGYEDGSTPAVKHVIAENYEYVAQSKKYKEDFVAVNHHAGSDLKPVFNELVMVAEQRAYDIQHIDYADRISILTEVSNRCNIEDNSEVSEFLTKFEEHTTGRDKMRHLCEFLTNPANKKYEEEILMNIPLAHKNYYLVLGPGRCKAFSYQMDKLETEYLNQMQNQKISKKDLLNLIYSTFKEGERYTKSDLKEIVQGIYNSIGLKKKGKANDFEEWFELKECLVQCQKTGKRVRGFELIKKKII